MPPKDIPGFYFDPEKNRYFPVKSSVPGAAPKRPRPPGTTTTTTLEHPGQNCSASESHRKKKMNAADLIRMREMHGRSLMFNRKKRCFEEVCQDMQALHPMVWKYQIRGGAQGALEQFHVAVETPDGQKVANLLSTGSTSGGSSICFYEIGKVGKHLHYGSDNALVALWPPKIDYVGSSTSCPSLQNLRGASMEFPSSITSISKIGKNSLVTAEMCFPPQSGLVSTLGGSGIAGSIYIINLKEPLDFVSNSFCLQERILKVASFNCTLWTAICSPNGKQAAVGTSSGAALVCLETGRFSWTYRSKSDIFSQQFDNSGNTVMCGLRNGAILAVDIRQKQQRQIQLSHRGKSCYSDRTLLPSSVCSLVLLRDDKYLLASSMDGSIKLFDRRFLQRGDVQSYEGHSNSHQFLQLGVSPSETHFLTGGSDCFVRIWNIKTAELLFAERVFPSVQATVCWPHNELLQSCKRNCFHGSLLGVDHSWGAWLGSREGVCYMQGK